jgi:O-acetyl-ADP-ribose deacetylase (regulator of RNase III)
VAVSIMNSVLKVVLVDINPRVVEAWRAAFADTPEVEVVHGSVLEQAVDAWVTPTNARGRMDGGVDAVIKNYLGPPIQKCVRREILQRHEGRMPVGYATCVPTGVARPLYLISTPTMVRSAENISATVNVALACAAAFQAIHQQNAREPDSILSVALPGLGAATGQVPPRICANLMWTGYRLFTDHAFDDFATMRAALCSQLGELGPLTEMTRVRLRAPQQGAFSAPPPWLHN